MNDWPTTAVAKQPSSTDVYNFEQFEEDLAIILAYAIQNNLHQQHDLAESFAVLYSELISIKSVEDYHKA